MTNIMTIKEAIAKNYLIYKYTFTDGSIELIATNQGNVRSTEAQAFHIKDEILAISIDISQQKFSFGQLFSKTIRFAENVTKEYIPKESGEPDEKTNCS